MTVLTAFQWAERPNLIGYPLTSSFQAFSPAQFEAMETPQVQAISAVKKESLTAEQQQAINDVIDRDPDAVDPWGPDDDCSGRFTSQPQPAYHYANSLHIIHTK